MSRRLGLLGVQWRVKRECDYAGSFCMNDYWMALLGSTRVGVSSQRYPVQFRTTICVLLYLRVRVREKALCNFLEAHAGENARGEESTPLSTSGDLALIVGSLVIMKVEVAPERSASASMDKHGAVWQ